MQVAVTLFKAVTALDAVGAYEVVTRLPGAEVRLVAAEPGRKRCDPGPLALVADARLAELTAPDVVVVSAGLGTRGAAGGELVDWIRAVHGSGRWTTSV